MIFRWALVAGLFCPAVALGQQEIRCRETVTDKGDRDHTRKGVFISKVVLSLLGQVALTLGVLAVCWAGLAPVGARAAGPATGPALPAGAVTILDGKDTFVRWIRLSRPAVIVAEPGAAERSTLAGKKIDAASAGRVAPDLPAGWAEAAFDDSTWPRTTIGRLANLAYLDDSGGLIGLSGMTGNEAILKVGVVALRGKFNVPDPAAVAKLELSLKYRGGVVVYLNGREVARGGLPDGQITTATPGLPYSPEAYLDAKDNLLPAADRVKRDDKETAGRIASRDHVLGPIALPAKGLHKGVNVLAVELHRSDYHPIATKFWAVNGQSRDLMSVWTPCGLSELRLSADGTGIETNAHRPGAVQVWNQDGNDRTTASDYGDPTEPLRPVVLTGARNGTFAGKVVVSSDQAIEGLHAAASELRQADGKGVLRHPRSRSDMPNRRRLMTGAPSGSSR